MVEAVDAVAAAGIDGLDLGVIDPVDSVFLGGAEVRLGEVAIAHGVEDVAVFEACLVGV